jgi:hypothetical protein
MYTLPHRQYKPKDNAIEADTKIRKKPDFVGQRVYDERRRTNSTFPKIHVDLHIKAILLPYQMGNLPIGG